MSTLYCARCGNRFEPDEDHVWIKAEHKLMNDRNDLDEFAMHRQCWERLTEEWMEPA
jgi:hypothetical protein